MNLFVLINQRLLLQKRASSNCMWCIACQMCWLGQYKKLPISLWMAMEEAEPSSAFQNSRMIMQKDQRIQHNQWCQWDPLQLIRKGSSKLSGCCQGLNRTWHFSVGTLGLNAVSRRRSSKAWVELFDNQLSREIFSFWKQAQPL